MENVQDGGFPGAASCLAVEMTDGTAFVWEDSPAAEADLRAGDQVLAFGTADATNHRELAAVREIVARNVGSAVRVVVRRQRKSEGGGWEFCELLLTPQPWRGPGVLGCLLMPFAVSSP